MPADRAHAAAPSGSRAPSPEHRRRSDDAGFSLMEVLVALGIISMVMGATAPFLVKSINLMGQQRTQQGAIQVANDAVERARGLKGTALLSGRGKKAAKDQWNAAPSAAEPLLDITTLDSDTLASDTDGAQAPLPTKAQTVTIDKIDYVRNWYVGRCWQPTTKRDDPTDPDPALNAVCLGSKNPKGTDVPFFRVVVAVTWAQPSCPAGQCAYVTSTLISSTTDPVFPIKRPPPKITDPGTLVWYRTETASRQLSAIGGVLPLTWTPTPANLPTGVTLSNTGLLAGTPTTNGSRTVTLSVVDQDSYTDSRQFTFLIVDPLVVATPADQVGRVGTAVSLAVPTTGGQAPLSYAVDALPAGLTINTVTGVISGTPTTVGSTAVTVTVTDANGRDEPVTFDWQVLTPVQLTSPGNQSAVIGGSVNLAFAASGGAAPYTWSATSLPNGLSINANTGVVSGNVTWGTRFISTVSVTDSGGMKVSVTVVFSLTSALGLDLSVTAPAPASPNQTTTVNTTIAPLSATASNGALASNAWTAVNLPPGLTIAAAGGTSATISGKPTVKGVYTVTLSVREVLTNRYAYEMFTWTVQ